MAFRIAVLSDLHCHPKKNGTEGQNRTHFFSDGPRVRGSRHPVQYLVDLIRKDAQLLQADLLVLPGDFADQASIHGYNVAVLSVREIATLLGAKEIAATIGNHDVDSRNHNGLGPFYGVQSMFQDFPLADRNQANSFFNQGFAFVEGDEFRVVVINSVIGHINKEAAEAGTASPIEIAALRSALSGLSIKKFNICLVHHHVIPHEELQLGAKDLLTGGENLLLLLEQFGFCLVIHGHKHHPRLRYSTSRSLPIFASGSFSAAIDPVTGSACRNTFHIIELLEPDGIVAEFHGRVLTWDLKLDTGWMRTSLGSSSFPGTAGFGFTTSIKSLAKKVAGYVLSTGNPYVSWGDVVANVPEVAFLIPSDVLSLSRELADVHGLNSAPNPGEPTLIGNTVS